MSLSVMSLTVPLLIDLLEFEMSIPLQPVTDIDIILNHWNIHASPPCSGTRDLDTLHRPLRTPRSGLFTRSL